MDFQDSIDLLIVVGWAYVNGFVFALMTPFGFDPIVTSAIFGLVAITLGLYGIAVRELWGKFPIWSGMLIFATPFLCTFVGVVWQVMKIMDLV